VETDANLAVEAKENDHDEEQNCPQRSNGKLSHSLRVSNEDETRTCATATSCIQYSEMVHGTTMIDITTITPLL